MKNILCLLALIVGVPALFLGGWDIASSALSAPSTMSNVIGAGIAFATVVICLFVTKRLWRKSYEAAKQLVTFK